MPHCHTAQDDGSTIDNALRTVAYSMEEANWDLVEWMVQHHDSKELGPYFLTAIAQVGLAGQLGSLVHLHCCQQLTQSS